MFSVITNIYKKKETFVLGELPREIVSLVYYTGRFIIFSVITNIYNKKEPFVLGQLPREIVS